MSAEAMDKAEDEGYLETVAKRINPVFLFPAKKPVTGSS
jgi:hypothetical protein